MDVLRDRLDLVVIDPGALAELGAACRMEFIADLQRLSRAGGVHVLLPSCKSLAPESLLAFYEGWTVEEDPTPPPPVGREPGVATGSCSQPVRSCPPDTTVRRSTAS